MKSPSRLRRFAVFVSLAAGCALLAACGSSELSATRDKALKGDAQAQLDLAQMYLYGKGAKQDHEEAIKWAEKAANQGLPAGQRIYGVMIRDGYGVPRNLTRARAWLEKAAKQGDPEAKAELAAMPDKPAMPSDPK